MKNKQLGNPLVAAQVAGSIPKGVWYAVGAVALGLVGMTIYRTQKTLSAGLETLGIKDTKEEKQVNDFVNTVNYKKAFDPNYYKNAPTNQIISTDEDINRFAKIIKDALGFFNDDEESIYGVFKQIPTHADISRVVARYFELYNEDLYNVIFNALDSDTEFIRIIQIINDKN